MCSDELVSTEMGYEGRRNEDAGSAGPGGGRGKGGAPRYRWGVGAGSDRAGGGEAIFFSAHRLNWVVKLVWVMRVGAPREQRNARDSQKDHRETSSPGR